MQISKLNLIGNHLVQVIKHWVDRVDVTGGCETAKRSGRPRSLDDEQEQKVVKTIRKYCKDRSGYTTIRRKSELFNVTARTINNYGLKNGFRELKFEAQI